MIEIIKDKKKWDSILKSLDSFDLYHTYDYHHITKNNLDVPILVKYTEDNKIIAIPFLLRIIDGSQYYDLTSVYGYPGPISLKIDKNFNNSNFIAEFKAYLSADNIISVFSRLNPFISNQHRCINKLGELSNLGKVVNIDLTLDLDAQLQAYHKRLRTHVNKARRLCNVKLAETKEEILAHTYGGHLLETQWRFASNEPTCNRRSTLLPYLGTVTKSDGLKKPLYQSDRDIEREDFLHLFSATEAGLNANFNLVAMKEEHKAIIGKYLDTNYLDHKKRNRHFLRNNLNPNNHFKILDHHSKTTFGLQVLFQEEQTYLDFRDYLIQHQIYPSTLWPGNKKEGLWHHMLNIHIDFRYSLEDMAYLATCINNWQPQKRYRLN
jgi:hypothetical protein